MSHEAIFHYLAHKAKEIYIFIRANKKLLALCNLLFLSPGCCAYGFLSNLAVAFWDGRSGYRTTLGRFPRGLACHIFDGWFVQTRRTMFGLAPLVPSLGRSLHSSFVGGSTSPTPHRPPTAMLPLVLLRVKSRIFSVLKLTGSDSCSQVVLFLPRASPVALFLCLCGIHSRYHPIPQCIASSLGLVFGVCQLRLTCGVAGSHRAPVFIGASHHP